MQQNCGREIAFTPANDLRGKGVGQELNLERIVLENCPQYFTPPPLEEGSTGLDCPAASLLLSVPTASLPGLNDGLNCGILNPEETLCLPRSCPIAHIDEGIKTRQWVDQFTNFTLPQFMTWNPFVGNTLGRSEVVCVGPPGGMYMPIKVNPAQPTTYTTTATPASPTSEGSIPNCGRYYSVVPGDICYTIALNFSITFDEFRSMNPSIDAECTNLLSGFDYCVATVDGTTSPEPPSPTVTPVPPPTSTAPGTTSQCYEWYTTVSGDDCGKIMSAHRISLSQFRTWNPYIDSSCSNLWADTAYCVSSAQLGASIKTSSSTAVATVAPPGPTNEGASTACAKWHVVQSGDSCDAIASRYGITFAQFRSWNPWVNEGCTNIWPDFAYCVTMP